MPRKYQRKLGARKYCDYTEEKLQECLNEIRSGLISHRKAEEKYCIPRRTLLNKLKKKHTKKPGKQPVFSNEEEDEFEKCIVTMSEYGFPVDTRELRHVMKNYLNRCGRKIKIFKDNLPGKEWTKTYLTRHPRLSERFAENVKRTRAAVDEKTLRSFIENLGKEIENVPERNIWNFDETNLTDDPGKKQVLVRKGCKYPETLRNASKTSISVMYAGNAAGELLPPYVVYRATHMWSTWTENGPRGCRYNCSSSGWFDAAIFTEWLESQMIPRLKRLDGKKVIICDNLSSHLTVNTLQLCSENNVRLVCLPPNSTHLTQPLDVAVFRPLKIAWRKVLSEWKDTDEGILSTNIQKQHFPPLLKKLMDTVEPNVVNNLKSGFRKCGIVPLNVEELLNRIPRKDCMADEIQSSFIDNLSATRLELTKTTKTRRKKLNIPPGKSVCLEDEVQIDKLEINAKTKNRKRVPIDAGSGSESEPSSICDDVSSDGNLSSLIEEDERERQFVNNVEAKKTAKEGNNFAEVVKQVGQYVVFVYDNEIFPGQITSYSESEVTINAMQKSLKSWKWPEHRDEMTYLWADVLGSIKTPIKISKRNFFSIPELDNLWWT